MPYLDYPRSDSRRLELLRRAEETGQQDAQRGTSFLPEELMTRIAASKNSFQTHFNRLNETLSARQKEVREKNEVITLLGRYTRDFFEVAKRRTYRLEHPAEVLRYYGITLSGDLPGTDREADLIMAAQNLVQGDDKAVEAGFPAMQNPTAEEVAKVLEKVNKERSEIAPADRDYNEVQKAMEDQRQPVDELIREISDYIQFSLRKENPSNRRRILRTYGFEFRYLKGEPQEEEVVQAR